MRFLGLDLADRVPDAHTIWLFREKLTKAGYIPMSGQIVDASLVATPRQRNTMAKKADLKAGKIPED